MRHRRVTVGALVASMLGVGLEAIGPLLIREGVNGAIGGDTGVLAPVVGGLLVLGVLKFVGAFVRRYLGGKMALNVQHDLRRAVFGAVQRMDGVRQDRLRTGQVASRAISDLQLVQGFLSMVPLSAGTVVLVVVAVVAMLYLSPLLTVVALVLLPLAFLATNSIRRRLFPATWSAQQRAAEIAQQVEETVTGVRVVKGFGQEARETATLEGRARRLYGERLRAAGLTARLNPMLLALPGLGQVAVIGIGGWMAARGTIDLGTFLAFTTYVGMLVGPARLIGALVVTAQLTRAGAERVFEIVDSAPGIVDPERPASLPEGPLTVELEDVRFGYEPAGSGPDGHAAPDPVLDGLSLRVEPGETLALVGPPGSGKSTVALLLPRFYDPQAGRLAIGGVDLRDLRLHDLRAELGVVFEEAFLFSDTIRNNIAYGRPDADEDEIRAAAEAAQVASFVEDLPDGYDTEVGERGLTLSGGQRQRIALARAMLTRPRVLVLDDATSAVDTATEAAIHETLHELTAERTTLLVAHRRSTLALADRIAVLDKGQVVDTGTEDELRSRCALFRELLATGPADELGGGTRAATVAPVGDEPADDTGGAGAGETMAAFEAAVPAVTPELWPRVSVEQDPDRALTRGGGGGAAGWAGGISATPELLESVAKLPPVTETPRLHGDDDPTAPDPAFRLSSLLRPVRWLLVLGVALMTVDALATLALPSIARIAVDDGIADGATRVLLLAALAGLLIVVLDAVVVGFQTLVTARAGESLLYLLRLRSYAHLQRLGLDFYERELSGRIMTRMTTDVDALSTFLQTGLAQAVVSLLTIGGVATALVLTDPELALYALGWLLPLLAVGTVVFRRFSSRAYAEARERVSVVNADLQENVSGVRIAQAYVREELSYDRFGERSDAYRRSRLRAQRYIATYFPFVGLLSDIATAVVLFVGGTRIVGGDITPGVLTAFLLYLTLFFGPVQQLSQVFDGYQQARVGLNRISELLRTPTSVPDEPQRPVPVPSRLRGEVELDHVTFRYPGVDAPALDDVSLRVGAGETVALVGATGAGKSTLIKLIARFYDTGEGQVRVDGVDVRRFPLAGYRSRLGVVPQEAHLFTGDVASNIAYGRPDAPPERIEAAARAVGALGLVRSLPQGFHTPVGERGQGLSAGQRQLVALARAELVDPDVLIFDEATAALDPATEATVLAAGERVASRRTAFVVAHRLQTARRSDRIVVLSGGRIAEEGTHDELVRAGGRYAALWRAGELELEPDSPLAART
ncbi:Transport ATP-binding protein CydD [Pseudonocardia sp. Ae406_Ps2]|uniref:ABC transporter ATP-binding protein n=1 Tax=unclassified Pseudonocardia TaxID=2619320 RepID=UPI0009633C4A|nr:MULTISPECIES: ABC transporter ATP-binding protein [unclassified Pseudonocardia]OLL97344.1 Transport ATP-binding protein CydD [Pseudonocardia sp. Ae331_Ps2]OLM04944.1 Transport ATP-binding protein CydD [Pseudonocardia sp. Ae406_Ps2]OLM26516.1 Transport ATP-binding protein CydD [Pseudonocardia sp. Ae706_Ps2]